MRRSKYPLALLAKMKGEGMPFTLSELAVKGDDLIAVGVPPQEVGNTLKELLLFCAEDGRRNTRATLFKRVKPL